MSEDIEGTKPKRQRILILSASAGQGHVRAAQALEKAFRADNPATEVRCLDALDYTSPAFRTIYAKTYLRLVNTTPGVLGFLYDYADTPWRQEKSRLVFDVANALPLVQLINQYKPDLVVCTHFMPAEIISALICRGRLATKLAVVVTDIDVHAYWLCHHYSHYFVFGGEAKAHLERLGFAGDRITATGIPVDPVFAQKKDKQAMRAKYGLDLERKTIYLSAGGFGVGPTDEILAALEAMQTPVQVLAMCGRNQKMQASVRRLAGRLGETSRLRLIPVGFTHDVDEYMACADLVLGKPGGLTTSEALCRDLVFVIVNPIPGQEERNSDHLLESGCALRANNILTLSYKLDGLLSNPSKLAAMQANVQALAKPNAAADVVRVLAQEHLSDQAVADANHVCRRRRLPLRLRRQASV